MAKTLMQEPFEVEGRIFAAEQMKISFAKEIDKINKEIFMEAKENLAETVCSFILGLVFMDKMLSRNVEVVFLAG